MVPAHLFPSYRSSHKLLMTYALIDTDNMFSEFALESFRADIIHGYPDGYLSSSYNHEVMSLIYYLDERVLRQQGVKHVAQYEH